MKTTEIDAVTGSIVDSQFIQILVQPSEITRIALLQSLNSGGDNCARSSIFNLCVPLPIRITSRWCDIVAYTLRSNLHILSIIHFSKTVNHYSAL